MDTNKAYREALITFLCLVLAYFIYKNTFLDMDVAWHVEGARRLLLNGDYLVNVFDDNSPFVFAVFFPIVWLHNLFSISYLPLIILYTLILTTISLFLCYSIIKSVFKQEEFVRGRILYYILLFALLYAPLISFGHREVILINFMLPYCLLLIFSLSPNSSQLRFSLTMKIIYGLLASFAIMQNIFYLVIIIFLDSYYYYRVRKFQSYQAIFYFATLAQAILIYIFYPDYVKQIIPMVLCYEQGFNESFLNITFSLYSTICLISIVLYLFNIKKLSYYPEVVATVIAMVGAWLIYLFEKKIWYNHIYPALVFAMIFNALILLRSNRLNKIGSQKFLLNLPSTGLAIITITAYFAIVCNMIIIQIQNFHNPLHPWNQWIKYTNQHFNGKSLYYFTLYDPPGYMLPVYSQSPVVSPWLNPWFLPYILGLGHKQPTKSCQLKEDVHTINHLFLTSLNQAKPDFVLIYIPSSSPFYLVYTQVFRQDNVIRQLKDYRFYSYFRGVAIFKRVARYGEK